MSAGWIVKVYSVAVSAIVGRSGEVAGELTRVLQLSVTTSARDTWAGAARSPCPTSGPHACRNTPSAWQRSEEHTSELQSLMRISYAGFCLKKKKVNRTQLNNK